MKLTLGFSPCPNDTFIFDALVNSRIETEGLEFDVIMEDVQTLNEWAKKGKLNITKISYVLLPSVLNNYILLNSGGALGKGVGPLLISHPTNQTIIVEDTIVAIPGEDTTAHFLFSLAYPNAKNKVFLRFDEIESFVSGKRGLGVIIHENRFTYSKKGLYKINDLGDYWEKQTGLPIPLGGIVIHRNIHRDIQQKVDGLIQKSLQYAFNHYPHISDYVKNHAQEMDELIMRQHIDLYVNNYSLDLGQAGREAILKMIQVLSGDPIYKVFL